LTKYQVSILEDKVMCNQQIRAS